MSLGYAEKLTYRPPELLGGKLGEPEHFDDEEAIDGKVRQLTEMVQQSAAGGRGITVFTGAGISTSCGIPDFRGPHGIWTLQAQGKAIPKATVDFALASPSLTHMALAALVSKGMVRLICSQNVDGLHRRSGVPPGKLAELHGNCFLEKCHRCAAEFERDFEVETVGFNFTGRKCPIDGCRGRLKDVVLDWESPLPEEDLLNAEKHARESSLALCLGTSLRITPACDIPLLTKEKGDGKLVIVNLQETGKDGDADMVLHATCDRVMHAVMVGLMLAIPRYVRQDVFRFGHKQRKGDSKCALFVRSVHGDDCPMPCIASAEVRVSTPSGLVVVSSNLRSVFDFGEEGSYEAKWRLTLVPLDDIVQPTLQIKYAFSLARTKSSTDEEVRKAVTVVKSFPEAVGPGARPEKKARLA